jgi:hypothetical protein
LELVWEDVEVIYGPHKSRIGDFHHALLWIDVEKGDAEDRFDALGLGRHRHTDDWAEAARAEASPE